MSQRKKPRTKKAKQAVKLTRRRLLVTGAVLLVATVSMWFWYSRVVVAHVEYEPCEAKYGEVVHEWEGSEDKPWDKEGYYYQTRSYSVTAHAPDVRFPNTAELRPHRIATGGRDSCLDNFNETINPATGEYRWKGSRADEVYFGAPQQDDNSKTLLKNSLTSDSDYRSELSTPMYGQPARASVWVDDGAEASVGAGKDQDGFKQLFCINFNGCGDITEQERDGKPVRGSGFQYVAANCPESAECSDNWYDQSVFRQFQHGGWLKPFNLRLRAVSTFADTAGTEVLLTFRHPARVDLTASFQDDTPNALAGQTVYQEVKLTKTGPSVDELTLKTNSSNLSGVSLKKKDVKENLDELNRQDSTSLTIALTTVNELQPGDCYEDDLELLSRYGNQTSKEKITVSYCIHEPIETHAYDIKTRGETTTNLKEFASQAAETLSDGRGWPRANVAFERASQGGGFTLWVATPDKMTSFSESCSPEYSCRVGNNVIINDDRWQNASPSWNEAGGSLRDYRHMVINHEVGHLLGLGHYGCPGNGQLAPIMQQQSIDLDGCRFNSWPLQFEVDAV